MWFICHSQNALVTDGEKQVMMMPSALEAIIASFALKKMFRDAHALSLRHIEDEHILPYSEGTGPEYIVALHLRIPKRVEILLQPLLRLEQEERLRLQVVGRDHPFYTQVMRVKRKFVKGHKNILDNMRAAVMGLSDAERIIVHQQAFLWNSNLLCSGSSRVTSPPLLAMQQSVNISEQLGADIRQMQFLHSPLVYLTGFKDAEALREWGVFATTLYSEIRIHPIEAHIDSVYIGPYRFFRKMSG